MRWAFRNEGREECDCLIGFTDPKTAEFRPLFRTLSRRVSSAEVGCKFAERMGDVQQLYDIDERL